jgi:hypothetical protein
VETRLKRLGLETKLNKLGVDTRLKRFAVDTSPIREADERYPALPNPVTVDCRFGRTTGCWPFKDDTKKLLIVVAF